MTSGSWQSFSLQCSNSDEFFLKTFGARWNRKKCFTAITVKNCASGHKAVTNRRVRKGDTIRQMLSNKISVRAALNVANQWKGAHRLIQSVYQRRRIGYGTSYRFIAAVHLSTPPAIIWRMTTIWKRGKKVSKFSKMLNFDHNYRQIALQVLSRPEKTRILV